MILTLLLACLTLVPGLAAEATTFSLMTFNVENLFDTEDAPGRDDRTFLPLAKKRSKSHVAACMRLTLSPRRRDCLTLDWSTNLLERKLAAIAKAVRGSKAHCPDILVLQEVENRGLLRRLAQVDLHDCGYSTAELLEGTDPRGINVGLLTRFKTNRQSRLHRTRIRESREILEVGLSPSDSLEITILAVHFPSQAVPSERRQEVFAILNDLGARLTKAGHLVVAAGDFNVDATEEAVIYRQIAVPFWRLAHLEGCKSCLGTYHFRAKQRWSFFDNILIWRTNCLDFADGSVKIGSAASAHTDARGRPKRFALDFAGNLAGVSDHLPLRAVLSGDRCPQSRAPKPNSSSPDATESES